MLPIFLKTFWGNSTYEFVSKTSRFFTEFFGGSSSDIFDKLEEMLSIFLEKFWGQFDLRIRVKNIPFLLTEFFGGSNLIFSVFFEKLEEMLSIFLKTFFGQFDLRIRVKNIPFLLTEFFGGSSLIFFKNWRKCCQFLSKEFWGNSTYEFASKTSCFFNGNFSGAPVLIFFLFGWNAVHFLETFCGASWLMNSRQELPVCSNRIFRGLQFEFFRDKWRKCCLFFSKNVWGNSTYEFASENIPFLLTEFFRVFSGAPVLIFFVKNWRKCCLSIFLEHFGSNRLVELCETNREKCCRNFLEDFWVIRLLRVFKNRRKCCPFFSKMFLGDSTCDFVLKKAFLLRNFSGARLLKFCFENRRKCCPFILTNFWGIRLVEFCETYMEKCCRNSLGFVCVVRLVKFVFPLTKCCPFCSQNFWGVSTYEFDDFWSFSLKPRENAVHFLKNFRGLMEFCETDRERCCLNLSWTFSSDSTCEIFVVFEEMLSIFLEFFACLDMNVC